MEGTIREIAELGGGDIYEEFSQKEEGAIHCAR